MIGRGRLLAAAIFLLAVAWLAAGCGPGKADRIADLSCPDCAVLILCVDALSANHLPVYGYDRLTTPNLDQLIERGAVVFDSAVSSSSWTRPAMASLETSLHPHNHRALTWGTVLPEATTTLAEQMRAAGYYTFSAQANPTMFRESGFAQGFETYYELYGYTAAQLAKAFYNHLPLRKGRFLALVHFMDAHLPYVPPDHLAGLWADGYAGPLPANSLTPNKDLPGLQYHHDDTGLTEADKQHIRTIYDRSIRAVDEQLPVILDHLKLWGRLEETIIVLLADHGEEFWEHGAFEHGHSVYNELVRAPLVIFHPKVKKTVRIEETVRLIDVAPTLLAMLGLPPLKDAVGRDLSPFLTGAEPWPELYALSGAMLYGTEEKAIQGGGKKLIYDLAKDRVEYYDLKADPGELTDLSARPEHAEEIERLGKRLYDLAHEGATVESPEHRDLNEIQIQRLKELGYM